MRWLLGVYKKGLTGRDAKLAAKMKLATTFFVVAFDMRKTKNGLQICNPFFDVQIARRILDRCKHRLIVIEISQISVTERFLAVL